MLTKETLLFTQRKGKVRPQFIKVNDVELLALAEDLVAFAEHGVGDPKRDVDEAMSVRALQFKKPKRARGLVKLLQDRMTVKEPEPDAWSKREQVFFVSMETLAEATAHTSFEDFERSVEARLAESLSSVRIRLHEDLQDARPIEGFESMTPQALLERYNLALAQGLLLYAQRLELTVPGLGRSEVRNLLRWLRFCRLVVEVRAEEETTVLAVEGPASLVDGAKRYGLQLAIFFTQVPALSSWHLSAQVKLPHRPAACLDLTHKDPLVVKGVSGYVPEELTDAMGKAKLEGWSVDSAPAPVWVDATHLAVPDFALVSDEGETVVVELFHRWHRGALQKRLAQLLSHPKPHYRIGVDRDLLKDPKLKETVAAHPSAFDFRGFPSSRTLRALVRPTKDEPNLR